MHKLALVFLGSVLLLSSIVCPAQNYPSDPNAVAFIKSMYNQEKYEDYSFLKSHCTRKMLKKLADSYEYEGGGFATWLFRSGAQDEKYNWGQNVESESKILSIVAKDDHWYAYTALDMGWKFTNWVYLIKSGNTFLIDDVITVYNQYKEELY